MWLENLKELKKAKGMSAKQIAEATKLPERTVARIFSGDTYNPYVDTLHRIVSVLGGSLDCILADSKAVVGTADLSALQAEVDKLNAELQIASAENAVLKEKVNAMQAENDLLRLKLEHKEKVNAMQAENDLLRLKLEHKEEIIAIHNHYNKLK